MQLRFLQYFTVLCEELHFGRAARRLAITQPPLSAAIKSLEDELGTQLLLRNSKLVQLTPAGAAFLIEANQILDRVAQARSVVKAVDSGMRGRLDIGTAGSLLYRDIPAILGRFRRESPSIEVVLHEIPSVELFQALMGGRFHAAFVNGPDAPRQLRSIALSEDHFELCLPEGHPLARKRSVQLAELADERFVIFSRAAAPAHHDNLIANFSKAGIHPRIGHRARSWLMIVAMVAQDGGVALVPKSMARAKVSGVRFVRLAGETTRAPAMLVWNPTMVSPALASFIASAEATIGSSKRT